MRSTAFSAPFIALTTSAVAQVRSGRPAFADQDRATELGQRRRLRAHHREMRPLRTARQKPLGTVGGDGLEAVQLAIDILQRHEQLAMGKGVQFGADRARLILSLSEGPKSMFLALTASFLLGTVHSMH